MDLSSPTEQRQAVDAAYDEIFPMPGRSLSHLSLIPFFSSDVSSWFDSYNEIYILQGGLGGQQRGCLRNLNPEFHIVFGVVFVRPGNKEASRQVKPFLPWTFSHVFFSFYSIFIFTLFCVLFLARASFLGTNCDAYLPVAGAKYLFYNFCICAFFVIFVFFVMHVFDSSFLIFVFSLLSRLQTGNATNAIESKSTLKQPKLSSSTPISFQTTTKSV